MRTPDSGYRPLFSVWTLALIFSNDLTDRLTRPFRFWNRRQDTDILVIGAGIAGLSLTLRLPHHLKVVVVTKGSLGESNTWYAQGGLAAAVGPDDDPELHFADTIAAGAGLCDEDAVRSLVEGGPAAVEWLLENGTRFDFEDHELALGKEAAHSRNRVIHAGGDATGAEIERSLVSQLRARGTVTILDNTTAIDLVTNSDGSCAGAIIVANDDTECVYVAASTTVLANGGAGQLVGRHVQPAGCDRRRDRHGDSGPEWKSLTSKFTQFHPDCPHWPRTRPLPDHGGHSRRGRLPAILGGRAVHARCARTGRARAA